MYQLNPLLEGNGMLSTAMNVARQNSRKELNGLVQGATNHANQLAAKGGFWNKTKAFFTKGLAGATKGVNKFGNSNFAHKGNRSAMASKLKSIRKGQGSDAARAYRDYASKALANGTAPYKLT